jgi:hypothetical protein
MEKMDNDELKKQIGVINYFPFHDLKIETKLKISVNGKSSVIIIEQTEFLPDLFITETAQWTATDSNKIIIDESQYADFCELLDLGLTFIKKTI